MTFDQINYLSVLVASVVSFIVGFLWYGPVFGKTWIKLNGLSKKDVDAAKKKSMAPMMILGFIGTFVTAAVLDLLITMTSSVGYSAVVGLSFLIWLGFLAATTILGSVLWDNKPWGLFLLNGAYWLVNLELIGIILTAM